MLLMLSLVLVSKCETHIEIADSVRNLKKTHKELADGVKNLKRLT